MKRLVLGFDAGCMTCSELARKIEEEVGDKLEVRSLHDQQIVHWREQALGENAPWAPTLVKVESGEVKAWTGLKMALALSRRLGPVGTWRVMQVLGEIKSSPKSATASSIELSRGKFIKGLGGAVLGVGVLSATGGFASPAHAAQYKDVAEKAKKAERAIALMEKHIKVTQNNTLSLDEKGLAREIRSGKAASIDSDIFTNLRRNLAKTNAKLRRSRKIEAANLLSGEPKTIEQVDPAAQEKVFSAQRRCRGRTGVDYYWWGKRSFLNNCRTNRLVRRLYAGAGAAAIMALVPGFGTAGAAFALFQSISAQGIAGANRGRGVYINYIFRIAAARVRSQ